MYRLAIENTIHGYNMYVTGIQLFLVNPICTKDQLQTRVSCRVGVHQFVSVLALICYL